MTLSEVRGIMREWQDKMKLGHWKIGVRWGKADELLSEDGEDVDGFISWTAEYRTAEIVLERKQSDEAMGQTVRHELCHLLLEGHKAKPGDYDPQYEFGLNVLSELL